jgi:type II restriction enzyme
MRAEPVVVGCNILLSRIPEVGKIFVVREGEALDRDWVCRQWRQTVFMRSASEAARGWLLNVLWCVERVGRSEFSLSDIYAFEGRLSEIFPENRHVRQKIRQQLQVLRDHGFVEFLGRGRYRSIVSR